MKREMMIKTGIKVMAMKKKDETMYTDVNIDANKCK